MCAYLKRKKYICGDMELLIFLSVFILIAIVAGVWAYSQLRKSK